MNNDKASQPKVASIADDALQCTHWSAETRARFGFHCQLCANNKLRAPADQAASVAVELDGVDRQLKEGAGFWHSCSGCYDTEDGHPTGPYSYSSVFGCALGNGCAECGGLGACWDNNDYSEEPVAAQSADKPADLPQWQTNKAVRAALHGAVAAIYFDDNSDYGTALWGVVAALAPDLIAELESNPSSVFDKTQPVALAVSASAADGSEARS